MNPILEALNRRYATKAYDSTKKVSDENLQIILEAMRLSASSYGLQPWKFIVVTNPELREKLKAVSYGQPQVTDASHLIVLTVKKDMTVADVDAYMASIAQTRGMPVEALDGFKNMLLWATSHFDQSMKETWNTKQVYIALGTWLLTAASLQIDASPMEWFNSSEYNQLLWLTDYSAAVIMAVWYRAESDEAQHYKKVRYNAEQVIEYK